MGASVWAICCMPVDGGRCRGGYSDAVHQRYRQALAMRSPSNTAGTLAGIMPSVVRVTRSVRVGAQDAAASRL